MTVNAIAPDLSNAMTDKLSEEVKARSVARAVRHPRTWLMRDVSHWESASYLTGQVLRVDGGLVMA